MALRLQQIHAAAMTLGEQGPFLLEAKTNPRNVYFKGEHLNLNAGYVEATVQKFRRDMVVISGIILGYHV